MGALNFHTSTYATEWPKEARRELDVTTFNNHVEIRVGAAGDERPRNGRTSVILTKQEALRLVADLQSAADYIYTED